MTFADRLKVVRGELRLKQEEISAQSDIPLDTYRKYEGASRQPGADALAGLVRMGINANWLLTGKGEMLISPMNSALYSVGGITLVQGVAEATKADYLAVPPYGNGRTQAGDTTQAPHDSLQDAMLFNAAWIRLELGAKPENLRQFRVNGDSMEPSISAGDIVLVDSSVHCPDSDGVYVLQMGGAFLLKRLQLLPGNVIKVSSDNSSFAAWQFKLADLNDNGVGIFGRVVWAGRRY